jgi:hypothetical protein
MCWALNHENNIEMAQGHISLSTLRPRPLSLAEGLDTKLKNDLGGGRFQAK